jgi:hypothetical protein
LVIYLGSLKERNKDTIKETLSVLAKSPESLVLHFQERKGYSKVSQLLLAKLKGR